MGCTASKDEIAAFSAMRERCEQLELDRAELEQNIITLEKEMMTNEQKSKEQLNLYRFKIEVMSNMLSVEEKKLESTVKRLETLKLAMLTHGFTDKAMNTLLRTGQVGKLPSGSNSSDGQNDLMTSAFDLGGAISRLTAEMAAGRAEDVIYAFANKQGKLLSHISRDDFCRYLYNVTESMSKSDVQVLALRFYDGSTVCVPEFIDFFTSSASTRVARAAAAAVRVSLNILQLEVDDTAATDALDSEIEEDAVNASTNMRMSNLQRAVNKLLALWEGAEEALIDEFMSIEEEIGGNQVVQLETFAEVLAGICGPQRAAQERKHRRASGHMWLTDEDINFIACRFEIGDRIDVKQFFNFFQDAHYSNKDSLQPRPAAAATPFQFSKDWSTLKRSAQEDLVSARRSVSAGQDDEDEDEECGSVEVKSEIDKAPYKMQPRPSTSPVKEKKKKKPLASADPKPALSRAQSEKIRQDEPVKPSPLASKTALVLEKPEPLKRAKNKKDAPPPKVISNTLVALFARDPVSFETKLESMSAKTGFIMTRAEFKVVLELHTAKDGVPSSEIDEVLGQLKYIGGTCSVTDLVEHLIASVEAAEDAPTPVAPEPASKAPLVKNKSKKFTPTDDEDFLGPFVNLRQQHIVDTIEKLKTAKLDAICLQHQSNPTAFLATLKAASVNNKTGMVDGTGNSVTAAIIGQALRDAAPKASQREVKETEQELLPAVRKDTNDIPLAAVTNLLKSRTKDYNATASNIKKQEKLLAEEERRNTRMEERAARIRDLRKQEQAEADTLCDQYFVDPPTFMENLKSGRDERTLSMADLQVYLGGLTDVTRQQCEQMKTDVVAADKKLSPGLPHVQVPYTVVEKVLKQRSAGKVKLLKQIENEKKLLQKDVDMASTAEDVGWRAWSCCGGGGQGVYDPSNAPQDLPSQTGASARDQEGGSKDNDRVARQQDEPPSDEDDDDDEEEEEEKEDEDEDLPRPQLGSNGSRINHTGQAVSKPRLKNAALSLSYSTDYGDDKCEEDGFRRGGGRAEERLARQAARSSRAGRGGGGGAGSNSDDDSLIFQSMIK